MNGTYSPFPSSWTPPNRLCTVITPSAYNAGTTYTFRQFKDSARSCQWRQKDFDENECTDLVEREILYLFMSTAFHSEFVHVYKSYHELDVNLQKSKVTILMKRCSVRSNAFRLLGCGTEHYFVICSSSVPARYYYIQHTSGPSIHSTHFGAIHSFNKFAMLLMPIFE